MLEHVDVKSTAVEIFRHAKLKGTQGGAYEGGFNCGEEILAQKLKTD